MTYHAQKKRRKWHYDTYNKEEKQQFLPLRLFFFKTFDLHIHRSRFKHMNLRCSPVRVVCRIECLCYFSVLSYFVVFYNTSQTCVYGSRWNEVKFDDISICCATLFEYVSSEMMSEGKQADNKRKCLKCTDNMPDGCWIPVTECVYVSCMSMWLLTFGNFSAFGGHMDLRCSRRKTLFKRLIKEKNAQDWWKLVFLGIHFQWRWRRLIPPHHDRTHGNKSLIQISCSITFVPRRHTQGLPFSSISLFFYDICTHKGSKNTDTHKKKICKMIHLMSFHSITHICYISI